MVENDYACVALHQDKLDLPVMRLSATALEASSSHCCNLDSTCEVDIERSIINRCKDLIDEVHVLLLTKRQGVWCQRTQCHNNLQSGYSRITGQYIVNVNLTLMHSYPTSLKFKNSTLPDPFCPSAACSI